MRTLKNYAIIMIVPLLWACEEDEPMESTQTQEAFFIEARVDGSILRKEWDGQTQCSSDVGACFTTGSSLDENRITLRLNKPLTAGISLNELQVLAGDTLLFKEEKDIYARLEWSFDGASFNTGSSIIQAQSYLYLQEVEPGDTLPGYGASAMLRGTFSCNLKSENGQATKSVREGRFYVRVFESN